MDSHYKTPQEVASTLDVSPSTLRRWSDEFMEFLSEEASSLSGKSHRRYTEQDVDRLLSIKDSMTNGLTYEQVRQQLREALEIPAETAIISNDDAMASTVIGYISETVENVRQGQMSVLNSQAANRELMGVVIQDNFSLKEENNRLRERMLDLERQLGEIRREENSRRESLRQEFEVKMADLREMVHRTQALAASQSRSGCLGGLFGGGGQPQAVPQPQQNSYPSSPPPRNYPKPPGPPE